MLCPHFNVVIVKRSKRKSVATTAAYQSGSRLYFEYDTKWKSYTGKKKFSSQRLYSSPTRRQSMPTGKHYGTLSRE